MNCSECAHSALRRPRPTHLEAWQKDKRPMRPKGLIGALRWFWNPSQFKLPDPYYHDDERWKFFGAEFHDAIEIDNRKRMVICTLNPKHKQVLKTHYCGQFKKRESKEYDWGKDVGKEIPERG